MGITWLYQISRAKSTAQYVISKGIAASRISGVRKRRDGIDKQMFKWS